MIDYLDTTNIDTDIDYEHMDDLPIFDHVESKFFQTEKIIPAFVDDDQDDWLTA